MSKGSGITINSKKKKQAAAQAAAQAESKPSSQAQAAAAKGEEVKRQVITYRINPDDKQLLTVYAATNGTKVQELLNQALKLLAVERDIPLSDEIMKG